MMVKFKKPGTFHFLIYNLLLFHIVILTAYVVYIMYTRPIHIFDEGIYANNSLEMAKNNQYLVYTNNGIINHYNTKPPLVLLLQALSFKILSYSEFALRLPTLLALLGVLFLFYRYCINYKLPKIIAAISTYILLTTPGAIRTHVFLSGDLDGVLVFFITLLIFNHLQQVNERRITGESIALLFVSFTLAYFAKSTAVLLILPALFFSYAYEKLLISLFKTPYFSLALFFSAVSIIIYYILRERYDRGYFAIVVSSEFKRYVSSAIMPWHNQPFIFYFQKTITRLNPVYSIITVLLPIPYFQLKTTKHKQIVFHIILMTLIYILVISVAKIKLEWYEAPVYPAWSFAVAVMSYELSVNSINKIRTAGYKGVLFGCLLLFTTLQTVIFYAILRHSQNYVEPEEREGTLIKRLIKTDPAPFYTLLADTSSRCAECNDMMNFYIKSARLNDNITINLKSNILQVREHDLLIITDQSKIDSLKKKFYITDLKKSVIGSYVSVDSLK